MCTSAAVIRLDSDDEPGPPTSRRQPPAPTYSRAPGRPACPFGINCYRRNPAHFESEDHPAEHPLLAAANSQQSQQRPAAVPAPAAAASAPAPAPAASEESNAGDGARAEPASAASSGSGGPSAVTIPSRYANPAVFLRAPKKDRPVEPVRIPLLRPFVGDNSLLIGHFNGATTSSAPVCKLAGFDFDDTLSERKAAGGKDKWRSSFWNHRFGSSPAMLRALHARGYRLLVLTNESVAHLKNADPLRAQITPKLERLAGWAADVGVPVLVLVATDKRTGTSSRGHTLHKQPVTAAGNAGMWHVAEELLGARAAPESFFVGDAAGRETDHGDDDRRLAAAAGVTFYTEDAFFGRDPLSLLADAANG